MKKLIYIAGSGKSGSTLLDIILGSHKNSFSIGELNHFFRKGLIQSEYCSCGEQIRECLIWKEVINKWKLQATLSENEYHIQLKYYESKKNIIRLLKQLKNPSNKFALLLNDTKLLYEIISDVSKCDILIDSSKSTNRALLLKKIFNSDKLTVVHLLNNYSRIVNSNKKIVKKNLAIGREKDTEKKGLGYVIFFFPIWFFENFIVFFFFWRKRKVVLFKNYILNPARTASDILGENFSDLNHYQAKHLMAGNHLRMKGNLTIDPDILNKPLINLNLFDKLITKLVDLLFLNSFLKIKN